MKRQWIVVGVAIMGLSMTAFGAASQGPGPQGVGSEKAEHSSHAPRSYNPVKWMKKDPNTASKKPKRVKDKKPSSKSANLDTPAPLEIRVPQRTIDC
ncbi:MAG TPA: hypothetical protein VK709_18380 [Candidatus Saccharimonadales bacterium]|nr:hypothetical protein [Candidatus Saccharimonadales bacterium]